MLPNPQDSSAETCVFVFNAVCNLDFSMKYFLAQLFFDLTSSPGLERGVCQHIQLQQFIPSAKPCCHQWGGWQSSLCWALPPQPCTISTPSSLAAGSPLQTHSTAHGVRIAPACSVLCESGQVSTLCFLSTALINVLSL